MRKIQYTGALLLIVSGIALIEQGLYVGILPGLTSLFLIPWFSEFFSSKISEKLKVNLKSVHFSLAVFILNMMKELLETYGD